MTDHKRSLIDLIWYVIEDDDRLRRFVVVVLVLALAAGLGLVLQPEIVILVRGGAGCDAATA